MFNVPYQVQSPGWYVLRARVGGGAGCFHVLANGSLEGQLTVRGSGVFECDPMYLSCAKGEITLLAAWGEAKIKRGELLKTTAPDARPGFAPSDPCASASVRRLMQFFSVLYGSRTLTGQHVNGSDHDLNRIFALTGQRPALMGFDMMSFTESARNQPRSVDCASETAYNLGSVERALYWGAERGAVISLCWHWFSPSGGRDKSFYTKNTEFSLARALDKQGDEYKRLLDDIDTVAGALARLRDADIPVLWRPLHEANGGWFWWGASGAQAYLELWRLMRARMTKEHGLHNLIWVWNAPQSGWYPGDGEADIASTDLYGPDAAGGALSMEYAKLAALTGGRLPAAIAETGTVPQLDRMDQTASPWLWFMNWSGFASSDKSNPSELVKRAYSSARAINLDEYVMMTRKGGVSNDA